MQRYLLFDLDGVLVETDVFAFNFYKREFARKGVALRDEDFKLKVGRKSDAFFEALSDKYDLRNINLDEITRRKRAALMEDVAKNTALAEGAHKALAGLKKAGFKMAVVSQNYKFMIERVLHHYKIGAFFELYVSLEDIERKKPDPEIYLKCLSRLKISKEQAVIVEDDADGIGSAKNAGIKVIAVTKYGDRETVSDADYLIESLTGLTPEFVECIFSKLNPSQASLRLH